MMRTRSASMRVFSVSRSSLADFPIIEWSIVRARTWFVEKPPPTVAFYRQTRPYRDMSSASLTRVSLLLSPHHLHNTCFSPSIPNRLPIFCVPTGRIVRASETGALPPSPFDKVSVTAGAWTATSRPRWSSEGRGAAACVFPGLRMNFVKTVSCSD